MGGNPCLMWFVGGELLRVFPFRRIILELTQNGEIQMVIYELYLTGTGEKEELIGVLPERRDNGDRIDSDSVMKWSQIVFGDAIEARHLLFVRKFI